MAEQTSAERFGKWWRRESGTYREWGSGQGLSRNDARKVWDAATAAAEERLDIARVSMATYLAVRDERDALRQRIAELEGR